MAQARAVGSIEILEKLATRESGEFYLGRQPALDRQVVLRKLRRDLLSNARILDRFHREARLGARVVHPNVLAVFDLFAAEGDHWLVLEHVDGHDLRELIERERLVPAEITARIGLELARALAETHDRGIVHADVRPENIWISRWGDVKLGGFSQARESGEDPPPPLPDPGQYTAPGFGDAGAPAARRDVFALGVILRELLTGDPEGRLPIARSRTGRALGRIIERCCDPLAARRPSSADLELRLARSLALLPAAETRAAIAAWAVETRRAELPRTPPARRSAAPTPEDLPEAEAQPVRRRTGRHLPLAGTLGVLLIVGGVLALRPTEPEAVRETPSVDAGHDALPAQVRFAIRPWAEVRVDERATFITPRARALELSPGPHRVVLSHPTFGEHVMEIEVEAGADRVVHHAFGAAR